MRILTAPALEVVLSRNSLIKALVSRILLTLLSVVLKRVTDMANLLDNAVVPTMIVSLGRYGVALLRGI